MDITYKKFKTTPILLKTENEGNNLPRNGIVEFGVVAASPDSIVVPGHPGVHESFVENFQTYLDLPA